MRGPKRGPKRSPESTGTWHARTMTSPRSDAATPDAVASAGSTGSAGDESGSAPGPGVATTRRILARAGVRTALGRDVVLAGVWAAVTVALLGALLATGELGSVPSGPSTPQLAVMIVLAVVQYVPLARRRIHPIAVLLVIAVVQAALLTILPSGVALWTAAPVIAAYTVATLRPTRVTVGAVIAAVGIATVGAVVGASDLLVERLGWATTTATPGAALFGDGLSGVVLETLALISTAVLVNGVSAAVGSWVALRRVHDRDARARAAESVEHQATLTRSAVAAERTRMARELHDVAAHHLTGLVVQAGAAERLVDGDPERAKESLRSVRAQGRETLDALRSIVGILRETGDDASGTAPVPGLADVPGLVDAARASGTIVEVRETGTLPSLPPLADVTAFRTVQEALVNARRHSPGAVVELSVDATADLLTVAVENDLPSGGEPAHAPGYGLVGMRERAALVGGQLEAGVSRPGRWRVALSLPVEADPASTAGGAA
jgi:signal transduction histidine kinase